MTQIGVFVIIGLLLLAMLAHWVQRSRSRDVRDQAESLEAQDILVCLQFPARTKPFVERIFSEQDWAFISRETNRAVQRLFETQRRRLAMVWLRQTRNQVVQLMTSYRAAVRQTSDVSAAVELRVALDYVLFLLAYYVLLVSVWLRGPLQTRKVAGYVLGAASHLCLSLGRLLLTVTPAHVSETEALSTDRFIAGH